MSDDNRMILDGANFDRTMPKWATEETLSRLERIIKASERDSKKQLTDLHRIMKMISDKESSLFKETKESNKNQQKSLDQIVKILGSMNTTNTGGNTSSNSNETKIVENTKKTTEEVKSGFTTLNKNTEKLIKTILSSNSDSARYYDDALDAHKRAENLLSKIYNELKSNTNGQGSSSSASNTSSNEVVREISTSNSHLSSIKGILSQQSITQNQLLAKTISSDQFADMVSNSTRNVTSAYESATSSSANTLKEMFERSTRGNQTTITGISGGSGIGSGNTRALTRTLGTFSSVVDDLKRIMRATPIGRIATAATLAFATVNKTFEYAYDAQEQFRGMIDQGFNFAQLSREVGPDRLDGIAVRSTITRNEIGLDTATRILENNTRLINEIGLSSFFGELGTIVGDINDPNSVTNRLGMTRDQVATIATDFFSLHRRIGGITENFNELQRTQLATRFVENIREMSQTVGTSTDQIRRSIESFVSTDEFISRSMIIGGERAEGLANLQAMLEGAGISSTITDALVEAASSPQLGILATQARGLLDSPLLASALMEHREGIEGLAGMDVSQQGDVLLRFFQSAVQAAQDRPEMLEVMRQDPRQRDLANALASMAQAIPQLESGGFLTGGPEEVSDIATLTRRLENMGQLISARTEDIFAQAAMSEGGREAIMEMLSVDEIMKNSQLRLVDIGHDILSSLMDGPIPTALRQIVNMIQRIGDAANWLTGRSHTGEITGRRADELINVMREQLIPEAAMEHLFQVREDERGRSVIDLREGISGTDVQQYFTQLMSEASTNEEREAIAGMVRSISRGVQGRQGAIGQTLQQEMSEIEEAFLGSATSMVRGDQRDRILEAFSGAIDSTSLMISTAIETEATNTIAGGRIRQIRTPRTNLSGLDEGGIAERIALQARQRGLRETALGEDLQSIIARESQSEPVVEPDDLFARATTYIEALNRRTQSVSMASMGGAVRTSNVVQREEAQSEIREIRRKAEQEIQSARQQSQQEQTSQVLTPSQARQELQGMGALNTPNETNGETSGNNAEVELLSSINNAQGALLGELQNTTRALQRFLDTNV